MHHFPAAGDNGDAAREGTARGFGHQRRFKSFQALAGKTPDHFRWARRAGHSLGRWLRHGRAGNGKRRQAKTKRCTTGCFGRHIAFPPGPALTGGLV
jgi:hypothetical protein